MGKNKNRVYFKRMKSILESRGYKLRTKGSHYIFSKQGHNTISINIYLNEMVFRRLLKEINTEN